MTIIYHECPVPMGGGGGVQSSPGHSLYPPTCIMISPWCWTTPKILKISPIVLKMSPIVLMIFPMVLKISPMTLSTPTVLNTHYTGCSFVICFNIGNCPSVSFVTWLCFLSQKLNLNLKRKHFWNWHTLAVFFAIRNVFRESPKFKNWSWLPRSPCIHCVHYPWGCIVCSLTSGAVPSHCFTDCTYALGKVLFVWKLVARESNPIIMMIKNSIGSYMILCWCKSQFYTDYWAGKQKCPWPWRIQYRPFIT